MKSPVIVSELNYNIIVFVFVTYDVLYNPFCFIERLILQVSCKAVRLNSFFIFVLFFAVSLIRPSQLANERMKESGEN